MIRTYYCAANEKKKKNKKKRDNTKELDNLARNLSLPFSQLQNSNKLVLQLFTDIGQLVRIHRQLSIERRRVESAKPQTALE